MARVASDGHLGEASAAMGSQPRRTQCSGPGEVRAHQIRFQGSTMKQIRLALVWFVRFVAYRLPGRTAFDLLRFAHRRGLTWSELDDYDYEANRERDLQYLRWRQATDTKNQESHP
jgi:hypothetical protein